MGILESVSVHSADMRNRKFAPSKLVQSSSTNSSYALRILKVILQTGFTSPLRKLQRKIAQHSSSELFENALGCCLLVVLESTGSIFHQEVITCATNVQSLRYILKITPDLAKSAPKSCCHQYHYVDDWWQQVCVCTAREDILIPATASLASCCVSQTQEKYVLHLWSSGAQ